MQLSATSERTQRDYALVCDARENGSGQAYAALMATYREPLYLLMLKMSHNPTTAADLTVETFSKAFLQLNRYAPTSSFSSWLFTIGINTYIDHTRRRHLETVPLDRPDADGGKEAVEYQIPTSQPNPEEVLMRIERDENIKQIVEQLKEPYREIVRLRYYEDMSYDEISKALNIPLGTVKIRLSRAKELLAATAKRQGGLI